ncbi:hypothetical protein GCM10028802_12660 [Terrabacter terrigena]
MTVAHGTPGRLAGAGSDADASSVVGSATGVERLTALFVCALKWWMGWTERVAIGTSLVSAVKR